MNVEQEVGRTLKIIATQDEQLDGIFKKYLELDSEKHKGSPGYMAWALAAHGTCMALANVLLAVKHPNSGRSFRAIQELSYLLGANDFWAKNSPVLMPILTAALNAHKDYLSMVIEQESYREYATYDKLMSGAASMPLEIFSIVLYLTGGPLLMASSSLPLKLALAPYFLK